MGQRGQGGDPLVGQGGQSARARRPVEQAALVQQGGSPPAARSARAVDRVRPRSARARPAGRRRLGGRERDGGTDGGGSGVAGHAVTVVGPGIEPERQDRSTIVAWDFSTEPEFEEQLAWMRGFVRDEIFPLETLDLTHERHDARPIKPLQDEVKARGLWAAHLPPELGGGGLRPGQARPDARDPRPVALRPGGLRQQRARLGQRRAAGHRDRVDRPGRQREQWLQPLLDGTAAQRLLDDRARGRGRSRPCSPPRPSGTATSG